jgi:hypothetical protein
MTWQRFGWISCLISSRKDKEVITRNEEIYWKEIIECINVLSDPTLGRLDRVMYTRKREKLENLQKGINK